MTKDEAKSILIKDVLTMLIGFIVGGIIGMLILSSDISSYRFGEIVLLFFVFGLIFGGLPLGWKWASKVITAVGLISVLFKGILSIVLGWIAAPITVIKDIILFIKIRKEE